MIVPGMFVCSSFLISVCMFIVSKGLLISSATVIVRAGRAIWLNPFATVLFSVCSAVTVECILLTLSLLYFWYGSQTVALYSIKERIKEKPTVCLNFSGQPFRLRRIHESLGLALFVMVPICFDRIIVVNNVN